MDEMLILNLENSKNIFYEINEQIEESVLTEKEIDLARNNYKKIAFHSQILYFCINILNQ